MIKINLYSFSVILYFLLASCNNNQGLNIEYCPIPSYANAIIYIYDSVYYESQYIFILNNYTDKTLFDSEVDKFVCTFMDTSKILFPNSSHLHFYKKSFYTNQKNLNESYYHVTTYADFHDYEYAYTIKLPANSKPDSFFIISEKMYGSIYADSKLNRYLCK